MYGVPKIVNFLYALKRIKQAKNPRYVPRQFQRIVESEVND